VIIVSSGAVGVGCQRLGLAQRPTELAKKQALAAVGQVHLMRYYEDLLNAIGLVSGWAAGWDGLGWAGPGW
jgi:glutamate 5-kinase